MVMSDLFWSTVLQCGARLPIHILNHGGGVFECGIVNCRSVAVL